MTFEELLKIAVDNNFAMCVTSDTIEIVPNSEFPSVEKILIDKRDSLNRKYELVISGDKARNMLAGVKEYIGLKEDERYLYLLYDWRTGEIIYQTRSQLQMYAKVGKMQIDGVYEEDMHVIMVDLKGTEK
ncbi:Uncharacterised protein [Urinicoccus massiliensis]|uniref:Uncharacterized protein n=1 Tax=Urinicoccus massiliensis TaxID=1723382 RepID=A0A8H2QYT0_9FIRM|nr:hypothetical protein [Urinicoccus massiliensis]VFB17217.1 Uncharacterised protein [Urinicoccus massiliensis]